MTTRWGVFETHASDDGNAHVAPIDRQTLCVASPHVLAGHCPCHPRIAGRLVVHETISDYVVALAARKALLQ